MKKYSILDAGCSMLVKDPASSGDKKRNSIPDKGIFNRHPEVSSQHPETSIASHQSIMNGY